MARGNLRRYHHYPQKPYLADDISAKFLRGFHRRRRRVPRYAVAATGNGHGDDYLVQDYELGVLTAAKAMAMTVVDLLADGAQRANQVIAGYDAPLSIEKYLSLMRSMYKEETFTEGK